MGEEGKGSGEAPRSGEPQGQPVRSFSREALLLAARQAMPAGLGPLLGVAAGLALGALALAALYLLLA